MDDKLPERKHPRLLRYDYSQAGYYHIVICVKKREPILSHISLQSHPYEYVRRDDLKLELTKIGTIADKYIKNIDKAYENASVDFYIIMPDHIHLIVKLVPAESGKKGVDIFTIVRSFKRMTCKEINDSIWQDSFYDHIIRNESDLRETRKYIRDNPLRWYYDKSKHSDNL